MYSFKSRKSEKGFSLIEVLIVIGISVIIFAGLFASFEYSLKLIAHSRAKMTALSLATDRVEYLRSLPYNDVGTVSGIPNGAIPQNRTVSLNGIDFNERVLVEYVDDPADGLGAADGNSIVADYKTMKVEYTWTIYGSSNSFSLISTIVPKSIETTAGGGTFRVNVFDANAAPLPGADVRLFNNTGTSSIDVTRKTDAMGVALFTGAPAGAGYEFIVTAPGYSVDQTRQATTSLPSPNTLPAAVLESDVSTMNFQIDRLSNLVINVFSSQVTASSTETFNDLLGVDSSASVVATTSALKLVDTAGTYDASGYAVLNPVTPTTMVAWQVAEVNTVLPASTEVRVHFYTGTSTGTLISETVLPGNLVGFTDKYIDLSALDVATFPTLVARIDMTTSDTSFSPQVNSIILRYVVSRTMSSGASLDMRGSKVIGSNSSSSAIYKFDISTSTNGSGQLILDDIEWDNYLVTLGGGRVIQEACSANPFNLEPDTTKAMNILSAPASTNNLRVTTVKGDGSPVIDATVQLRLNASSWSRQSSSCGQVFFGSLSSSSDYEIEVSAPGYATQTISSSTVSGVSVQTVTLIP